MSSRRVIDLASSPRVSGFALVPALFLIVVVALLTAAAVRVTTAQQQTVSLALQQARALSAARAGIDWAAYNALNGSCAGGTLSLPQASLAGYTIVVTCAATAYTNGGVPAYSYLITAAASYGTYGTPDYVKRSIRATFTSET